MLMAENRLDNDHMGSFHNANVLNCFKISDHDETRTRNLLIRSQTPYPLGHAVIEEIRCVESIRTTMGPPSTPIASRFQLVDIYNYLCSWGFCGVVVITSALHAEGREFEPRQNLTFVSTCIHNHVGVKLRVRFEYSLWLWICKMKCWRGHTYEARFLMLFS